MPQCQAFGCNNLRGMVNENGEKLTFFAIPDPAKSEESYELCRMWIRATGTNKFDHKKYKFHRDRVVCEQHFTSECFVEDMQARLMGIAPKKRLKSGSVPTIFSFRPSGPDLPPPTELRIQSRERQETLQSLIPAKKPKKGTMVKTALLDSTEIPEGDIVVGASQEVSDDTQHNSADDMEQPRRVVRKFTCFVRDIGIQVTVPHSTVSSQTSSDAVLVLGHGHDYLGSSSQFLDSEINIPDTDHEGNLTDQPTIAESQGSGIASSPSSPPAIPDTDHEGNLTDQPTIAESQGSGIASSPSSPPAIQRQMLDLPALLGQYEPNTFLKRPYPVARSSPSSISSPKPSPNPASNTTSPSISGRSDVSKPLTDSSSPSIAVDSPVYTPSEGEEPDVASDTSLDGHYSSREDKLIKQRKFIVFEQSLDDLIGRVRCSKCLTPAIESFKYVKGTMVSVKLSCLNGHEITTWNSQPFLKDTPCGNLLLSAAILHSGCSFSQIEQCMKFMGVECIGKSMFYDTMRNTLIPVVNHTFLQHQKEIFQQLRGKDVWLSGDGRCDSPGYNAKYCSYTLMNSNTQQIVHTELVQVSDTTSSVAMEKVGFKKSMDNIESNGVTIGLVATDRHAGIRKLIRTDYPHIIHNFDVWHFAKSVRKKLLSKAKKKDHDALTPWIHSICLHLWWCCQNCGQDPQMLREMWTSILKHIANVHSWVDGEKFHQCGHPPLSDDERRLKSWMKPGSPSHIAVQEVVLNKTILKDLEHMVHSCHTGALEVFHSSLLKFCPKRLEFSYSHMQARMHLAVIDHNMNINRKQATVKRPSKSTGAVGDLRFSMSYSKAQGRWVAKKVYEAKSYDYVQQMMADSIQGFEGNIAYDTIEQPVRPQSIAKVAKPDKAELVSKLKSRFMLSSSSVVPEVHFHSEENTEESTESGED